MTNSLPELSIGIVGWNTRAELRSCLDSMIGGTSELDYEVIVVDNASGDDSVEMLTRNYPWVKLIRNSSNAGFARACNQAIGMSSSSKACIRMIIEFHKSMFRLWGKYNSSGFGHLTSWMVACGIMARMMLVIGSTMLPQTVSFFQRLLTAKKGVARRSGAWMPRVLLVLLLVTVSCSSLCLSSGLKKPEGANGKSFKRPVGATGGMKTSGKNASLPTTAGVVPALSVSVSSSKRIDSARMETVTNGAVQMRPFIYEDTMPGPPPRLCGPKALKIVCEKLGVKADVEELAWLAGTDSTGTTLLGLKKAAESKRLCAQGLQVNIAYLEKMPKPVIAWIGHDHYVVVMSIGSETVKMIDPNQGQLDMAASNFVRIWDGYILAVSHPQKPSVARHLKRGKK